MLSSLLFAFWLSISALAAQVVSTDLMAIGYGGKIAISATNISTFSNYFSLNNGNVDLDFYFAPEDPKNGTYVGSRLLQPNGQVYIRFEGLNFQEGDSLTFFATELFQGTVTRHYVFVMGNFFPESGGPVTTCPRFLTCNSTRIFIHFDPAEIILDPSSGTPVTIEIPSLGVNTTITPGAYSVDKNAWVVFPLSSIDCNQMMLGHTIISFNGISCYFENGQLTCPPWTDVPVNLNSTCAPYFEDCLTDLIGLISDSQYYLPCQQWMTYGPCTTTSAINRTGKVAIGTLTCANNFALTVKNGIITDKVKISNNGWADYVFEEGYPLMPLEELEAYISKYRHLPNTPSGQEVEAAGSFELGETTINHQVKIEEIFLHLIKLEEETKALEAELFLYETLNKLRIKK